MSEGKWARLSPTQKSDIWNRWKAGQTLHEIGRVYGKPHNSIRGVLLPRGGISPVVRRRSRLALKLSEREDISRGIASGSSLREIAKRLDRAVSKVSREVTRHGGRPGLSSSCGGSASLGLGLASEEMSAGREPQVARHRCE